MDPQVSFWSPLMGREIFRRPNRVEAHNAQRKCQDAFTSGATVTIRSVPRDATAAFDTHIFNGSQGTAR